MRLLALLSPLLLLLLLAGGATADGPPNCGDHGTAVDGKCACSTPRPKATSVGYVGDECSIPVYYFTPSAEATNMALACNDGGKCTVLQPLQVVCFLLDLESVFMTPAHFGLTLETSPGASMTLQGLLTTERDAAQLYPNSSSHYNFVVSTTPKKPRSSLYLDKEAIGVGRPNSMYVCTQNVGAAEANVTLRAAVLSCPFRISPEGATSICSSTGPADIRADSTTCPLGMCSCTGKWARPSAPTYQGVGFEDCSASSAPLPSDPTATAHVDQQAPGTWAFFNFSVAATATEDRFVAATVTATADTSSDVELFLKYWQAPGREIGQYDLRSLAGDFRRISRADLSSAIKLSSESDAYKPGVWFLGIFVNGDQPVSYDVHLQRSSCPGDCGGPARGTCDAATGTCTCAKATFTGPDCSTTQDTFPLGVDLVSEPRSDLTFDHLQVPVGDVLKAAPGKSLSLRVSASFVASPALPAWVTDRPLLLVSGAPIADDIMSAPVRVLLQAPGEVREVLVEAGAVPNGTLYLSVYSPLHFPYSIGYTLSVKTSADCINACSSHGTCGEDGVCACMPGFMGPDCSVDEQQIKQQDCLEGSLREALDVAGGKAYAVCICSGPSNCSYTAVADPKALLQAMVICHQGFEVTGAVPDAIKLSDGRSVPGGGKCSKVRRGTSGGMVFFWCLFSIALFCGCVVGGRYGLEQYQVYRANQAAGYSDLGGGQETTLWDAFTGARRNQQHNDSW